MCHRFTLLSSDEVDRVLTHLRTVARLMDEGALGGGHAEAGALPPLRIPRDIADIDAFPGSPCPVIVAASANAAPPRAASTHADVTHPTPDVGVFHVKHSLPGDEPSSANPCEDSQDRMFHVKHSAPRKSAWTFGAGAAPDADANDAASTDTAALSTLAGENVNTNAAPLDTLPGENAGAGAAALDALANENRGNVASTGATTPDALADKNAETSATPLGALAEEYANGGATTPGALAGENAGAGGAMAGGSMDAGATPLGVLASGLARVDLTWGIEVSWKTGLVFNTRLESALEGRAMWRDALARGRCLVPVRAFFETRNVEPPADELPLGTGGAGRGGRKAQFRFAGSGDGALLLAGLREGDRFTIVTTEPNVAVAPVHSRMPVALTPVEALTWLFGTPADLAALADRSRITLERSEAPAPSRATRRPDPDQLSLF